jgi:hypothetical protein
MSLTQAEQIAALYRGNMPVDEIVELINVKRAYVLRCLTDAGLRNKINTLIRTIPEHLLPPRVNRDPCSYCNVRADIGCRHSRWAA